LSGAGGVIQDVLDDFGANLPDSSVLTVVPQVGLVLVGVEMLLVVSLMMHHG